MNANPTNGNKPYHFCDGAHSIPAWVLYVIPLGFFFFFTLEVKSVQEKPDQYGRREDSQAGKAEKDGRNTKRNDIDKKNQEKWICEIAFKNYVNEMND